MDSLHTGSNELVFIQTDKLSFTIKGRAEHPNFRNTGYSDQVSKLNITCEDDFLLEPDFLIVSDTSGELLFERSCKSKPIFYEQQRYEIIIEALEDHDIEFWHDNYNVRNKVSRVGRNSRLLSGVINFGNDIGLSDLIVLVNKKPYLKVQLEVFPSKISYQEDYQALMSDVTSEVYNVAFDFLKKTYSQFALSSTTNSSPVEFFTIISRIYEDFIHAVDMIMAHPHHILQTTHEILPSHKVKKIDNQTIRWIEKHPEQVNYVNGRIAVERAKAVKRQVTYDTKENRLTKYILQNTAKKLVQFKSNCMLMQRNLDTAVLDKLDTMISGINRRCNFTFLSEVTASEGNSGMSLVFSMASGYRELYKYYLMLLRGLSLTGDVFNLSVKDIALLYEYWCFIKLNSMMKEKYDLVSQDIIKVQGNGLYVSLVKGQGSRVKYRNPLTKELITLSYNPKEGNIPTVAQKPDNVLSLEKTGTDINYEYVFDAKYRINPALPGSDYYNSISHSPGPEISDINTMHRYRDAIVYRNNGSPFERTMFGAYVLFPYGDEIGYKEHRFYESIEKVNIGGLPFLPSATTLVSEMLDELISDSAESAFERAPLPKGIEEKLAKVDWSKRDVLVGALRDHKQFDICMEKKFYHIPASRVKDSELPIRYIAIYQSKKLFGTDSGICYYGEVKHSTKLPRRMITEIYHDSDEEYYRFDVVEWKKLTRPIQVKEAASVNFLTNMFLLEHSTEVPELRIKCEEEYRFYSELKRMINDTTVNEKESEPEFEFGQSKVVFQEGKILFIKDGKIVAQEDVKEFSKRPGRVVRMLLEA